MNYLQHSMTAFARACCETSHQRLSVEMKSLNHRFLEINLKLPESLRHLENAIRDKIQTAIRRGKVDIWVNQELLSNAQQHTLNAAAVEYWLAQFAPFSTNPDLTKLSWGELLSLPNVLTLENEAQEDSDEKVLTLVDQALEEFLAMRMREGAAIVTVLNARLNDIETLLTTLTEHAPKLQEKFREQLTERLNKLSLEVDNSRFEQELVFLLAKVDIQEELDRLMFHIAEARKTLQQKGGIGRRMDFLMQEFNREANTLGAKAGDHILSCAAVELKVLIEQMREQVQNLA